VPIATQIQRLNMINGKTWVLYFAYPAVGLSHCLAKDKQLDSPRRDILTVPMKIWAGFNTPEADVPVASLLGLNLRDSTAEDNVRKRPFTTKVLTLMPFRAIRVGCKITKCLGNGKESWGKIWYFPEKFLSLQRERRNQVEPRCAERWHGYRITPVEMMSNSTLPLGFLHYYKAGR